MAYATRKKRSELVMPLSLIVLGKLRYGKSILTKFSQYGENKRARLFNRALLYKSSVKNSSCTFRNSLPLVRKAVLILQLHIAKRNHQFIS